MDTAELRNTEALFDWTAKESKLSMSSLKAVIEKSPHEDLRLAYRWSEESSRKISRSIQGLEPFDHVKSCLARIHERCDSLVSSSSTQSSLQEEWGNNGLSPLVQCIAGQEWGSKKEHLQRASQSRYSSEKMLMIGDAPGDFKAAQSLGALFFPILPGREEESWLELKVHGLDRFFDGEFAGEYQESRLEEFFSLLPEKATWQGVC